MDNCGICDANPKNDCKQDCSKTYCVNDMKNCGKSKKGKCPLCKVPGKPSLAGAWLLLFPTHLPSGTTLSLMGWAAAKDKCLKCGGLDKVSLHSFRPRLPV